VRHTREDEERTDCVMDALFAERSDIFDQIQETRNAQTSQGRNALVRAALALAERDRGGKIMARSKGGSLAWMVVMSLVTS
jgi:hypothetical protein